MSCLSKQQDTGWAKTNKKNSHEREQQGPQSNPGLRPWSTYSRGAPRRWPFKYVQVMITQLWSKEKLFWVIRSMLSRIAMIVSCLQARLAIMIDVYFSQVKNKPWLPWVYSWIGHHRKQCSPLKVLRVFKINVTALRVRKTTRACKTTRNIENHKTMKSMWDQEIRKSTRVKEGWQVSRNQNLKSLEDRQIARVKNQENNS